MNTTTHDNYMILSNPSCIATFHIVYGLGKVKATRVNSFLLNHPNQSDFGKDFDDLMDSEIGHNILTKLKLDATIRLMVSHRWARLIQCSHFKAYRLFQNKNAGRRCNQKTGRHLNNYLALRANQGFYQSLVMPYKEKELILNQRFDELKRLRDAMAEKLEKEAKIDQV